MVPSLIPQRASNKTMWECRKRKGYWWKRNPGKKKNKICDVSVKTLKEFEKCKR